MKRDTIQIIKTVIMGLGIMNLLFGIAMIGYSELGVKIMVSSGIGLFVLYIIIWISQLPEPNKQQKEKSV